MLIAPRHTTLMRLCKARIGVHPILPAQMLIASLVRIAERHRQVDATPDAQYAEKIAELCRVIETAERPPSLADLAARAGLSESHLHRTFKRVTGVTPRQYAAQVRAARVRTGLESSSTVTDAIYDAGFGSSSRFYEGADAVLGMTPSEFRAGGDSVAIRFAVGECSLGSILVAASDRGVCAILLGDEPEPLVADLQRRFPRADLLGGDEAFERLVAQVVGLVEAPCMGLDLPLDIRGTAFQQRVWAALREIPAGETASYKMIADKIGSPTSTRAVAQACGANSLAVAIPCHRVVRTDGGLSGYRWGIERKRALLDREQGCSADAGRAAGSDAGLNADRVADPGAR